MNQVINLFEFNTLLNNEYMLKRLYPDPYDSNIIYLKYDTISKEQSIKGKYDYETNPPKLYHEMLREVLNFIYQRFLNNILVNYGYTMIII